MGFKCHGTKRIKYIGQKYHVGFEVAIVILLQSAHGKYHPHLVSVSIVLIANTLVREVTEKFFLRWQGSLGQSGEIVHIFIWVDSFSQEEFEFLLVWIESTHMNKLVMTLLHQILDKDIQTTAEKLQRINES